MDLPLEILVSIYHLLNFDDFLSFSLTCKRFNQIHQVEFQRYLKNFKNISFPVKVGDFQQQPYLEKFFPSHVDIIRMEISNWKNKIMTVSVPMYLGQMHGNFTVTSFSSSNVLFIGNFKHNQLDGSYSLKNTERSFTLNFVKDKADGKVVRITDQEWIDFGYYKNGKAFGVWSRYSWPVIDPDGFGVDHNDLLSLEETNIEAISHHSNRFAYT